jgi:CRP-like cAMP-binding protein
MSANRFWGMTQALAAHDFEGETDRSSHGERLYRKGMEILSQGDHPEAVYLVEAGLAKLLRRQADGTESIVALRGQGQFLGAASALLDREQATTATALTACRVRCFEVSTFRELVQTDTVLSWRLHQMLCYELEESLITLSEVRSVCARARLSNLLRRTVTWIGGIDQRSTDPVEIPLKQWEIAELLGVTPQYVCQMLSELAREGFVRRIGNRILCTFSVADARG